jgi:hypothetical protein
MVLLGHLFLGIAHIALLPPWEGFDETAHYSYLQQIADTFELPRQESARISKNVEEYSLLAPMPYGINGKFSYKSFFESPAKVVDSGYQHIHIRPKNPRKYTQGKVFNWQSQHPPLYYFILAPIYKATTHLSWAGQLFFLRFISYLFAWSALLIAVYTSFTFIYRNSSANQSLGLWILLVIVTWPIFFSSWYPGMARIGNDSLCAFIMALVWYVLTAILNKGFSFRYALILGMLLGLGCLTKTFFVPSTVGILSFLCIRQWRLGRRQFIKPFWGQLGLLLLIITCISGFWYVLNWYQHGVLSGSYEMILLKKAGGLLANLDSNFSMKAWLKGHATFTITLGWSSTWSHAIPPYIYLAPMAFNFIFAVSVYIFAVRHMNISKSAWLPVWMALPALLGFSFHVLVRIALTGEGGGPGGYYLHFLVAPLATALGIGFYAARSIRFLKWLGTILFTYALLFSIVISWAQVLLFSGIIYKIGGNKFYQLPESLPSLFGLPEALGRLNTLAFPTVGVLSWCFGVLLLLTGFIFFIKNYRSTQNAKVQSTTI